MGLHEVGPWDTTGSIDNNKSPNYSPKGSTAIYSAKISRHFKDYQTPGLRGSVTIAPVSVEAAGSHAMSGGSAQVWLTVGPPSGHSPGSQMYTWNGHMLHSGEPPTLVP